MGRIRYPSMFSDPRHSYFTHAAILRCKACITPASRQKWPAPSISCHSKLDFDLEDCVAAQAFKRRLEVKASEEPKTAKVGLCKNKVPGLASVLGRFLRPNTVGGAPGGANACVNGSNTGEISR